MITILILEFKLRKCIVAQVKYKLEKKPSVIHLNFN